MTPPGKHSAMSSLNRGGCCSPLFLSSQNDRARLKPVDCRNKSIVSKACPSLGVAAAACHVNDSVYISSIHAPIVVRIFSHRVLDEGEKLLSVEGPAAICVDRVEEALRLPACSDLAEATYNAPPSRNCATASGSSRLAITALGLPHEVLAAHTTAIRPVRPRGGGSSS
jgi:hypothetical protein